LSKVFTVPEHEGHFPLHVDVLNILSSLAPEMPPIDARLVRVIRGDATGGEQGAGDVAENLPRPDRVARKERGDVNNRHRV
jgi:hypothetical protein